VSAYDGAQLQHITEHEKVLKIIPVILQIITTAEMLSTDKDSKQHLAVNAAFSNLINNDIAKNEKVVINTLPRQNLFPDISELSSFTQTQRQVVAEKAVVQILFTSWPDNCVYRSKIKNTTV